QDLQRCIRRSVIHSSDFKIRIVLGKERLESLFEVASVVINGKYDSYAWHELLVPPIACVPQTNSASLDGRWKWAYAERLSSARERNTSRVCNASTAALAGPCGSNAS